MIFSFKHLLGFSYLVLIPMLVIGQSEHQIGAYLGINNSLEHNNNSQGLHQIETNYIANASYDFIHRTRLGARIVFVNSNFQHAIIDSHTPTRVERTSYGIAVGLNYHFIKTKKWDVSSGWILSFHTDNLLFLTSGSDDLWIDYHLHTVDLINAKYFVAQGFAIAANIVVGKGLHSNFLIGVSYRLN